MNFSFFDHTFLFGIISSVLIFSAESSYIFSIIINRTKPHPITWLIWSIITSTIFFVEIANHAGPGSWGIGASALSCIVITILTLSKKIKTTIRRMDIIFLIASVASIPIWYITSHPLYSIIILVTIDILGYVPTIRKTYYSPHEEKISSFALFGIGNIFSLLAVHHFSLVNILYQLVTIFINIILVSTYFVARKKYKRYLNNPSKLSGSTHRNFGGFHQHIFFGNRQIADQNSRRISFRKIKN